MTRRAWKRGTIGMIVALLSIATLAGVQEAANKVGITTEIAIVGAISTVALVIALIDIIHCGNTNNA